MEVIELIIDEDQELSGVDAISIVERPAIEENFIALSEQKEFKFESIDTEKRILIGALLIPDKKIIRRDGNREYYVYFSKKTIRLAMELYAKRGYQNNATFEHKEDVSGLTLVESWIKEDNNNDKSNIYGLDLPIGTWVGTIKVNNPVIWNDYVKTGIVKGFSIEGYFADLKKETEDTELSMEIEAGLQLLSVKAELLKNIVKKKELAKKKISFDFDDTLSTSKGTELAKRLIEEGNDIYIISARNSKEGILDKAKQLGISVNKIYATGSNDNKVKKIKELGIEIHYDNNEDVIKNLSKIGKLFKNER